MERHEVDSQHSMAEVLAAIHPPIRSEDNGDGTYTWHFSGEAVPSRVVPIVMVRRTWHARVRGWLARHIYPEWCDELS